MNVSKLNNRFSLVGKIFLLISFLFSSFLFSDEAGKLQHEVTNAKSHIVQMLFVEESSEWEEDDDIHIYTNVFFSTLQHFTLLHIVSTSCYSLYREVPVKLLQYLQLFLNSPPL